MEKSREKYISYLENILLETGGLYYDAYIALKEWSEHLWNKNQIVYTQLDYGINHSKNILYFVGKILEALHGETLTFTELFLLLSSAYLHDIGFKTGWNDFLHIEKTYEELNKHDLETIRKNHAAMSGRIIDQLKEEVPDYISKGLKVKEIIQTTAPMLAFICQNHNRPNLKKIFLDKRPFPNELERVDLLTALLQFGDAMDMGTSRISKIHFFENDVKKIHTGQLPEKGISDQALLGLFRCYFVKSANIRKIDSIFKIEVILQFNPEEPDWIREYFKQTYYNRLRSSQYDCTAVLNEYGISFLQNSVFIDNPDHPGQMKVPKKLYYLLKSPGNPNKIESQDQPPPDRLVGSEFPDQAFNEKTAPLNAPSVTGDDKLGIMEEVRAFARVISSSSTKPPLSIGLFGNWGSGKSFFMQKIKEEVSSLSEQARNENANGYYGDVAQIHFNAWHYSDTELWPSLVTHMYEKLYEFINGPSYNEDQSRKKREVLIKNLNIIQKTKEDAQRQTQKIEQKLKTVDRKIKVNKLAILFKTAFKSLLNNEKVKEKIVNLHNNTEELRKISTNVKKLKEGEIKKLKKDIKWSKIRVAIKALHAPFIFFVIVLVCAFCIPQIPCINTLINIWLKNIIRVGAPLVTSVTGIFMLFLKYKTGAKYLFDNLSLYSQAVKKDNSLESLRSEISTLKSLKKTTEEELIKVSLDEEEILKEIEHLDEKDALPCFIEKRISGRFYHKHLGIISHIRQDFELLSEQMSDFFTEFSSEKYNLYFENNENLSKTDREEMRSYYKPSKQNRKKIYRLIKGLERLTPMDKQKLRAMYKKTGYIAGIDRIVLYIDDLDRCDPKRVMEVLQAIHLLLAFRLFVVVVGVDVRWISKSLIQEYGNMLLYDSTNQFLQYKDELKGNATPYDYLEKIFQIPFRLKGTGENKRDFLTSLFPVEKDIEEIRKGTTNEVEQLEQEAEDTESAGNKTTIKEEIGTKSTSSENENPDQDANNADHKKETTSQKEEHSQSLVIQEPVSIELKELDFVQELELILGTSPRALKRYANIYMLIKSGPLFTDNDYRIILFILAIIIGSPYLSRRLLGKIKEIKNNAKLSEVIETYSLSSISLKQIEEDKGMKNQGVNTTTPAIQNLDEMYELMNDELIVLQTFLSGLKNNNYIKQITVDQCLKYIEELGRYSFRISSL